jgi:hypothetical protein
VWFAPGPTLSSKYPLALPIQFDIVQQIKNDWFSNINCSQEELYLK